MLVFYSNKRCFFLLCDKCSAVKNKKAEYEAELSKLKSPRDLQREELHLSEKITGLEKKIHYQNVEQVSASYFCIVFVSTRYIILAHVEQ